MAPRETEWPLRTAMQQSEEKATAFLGQVEIGEWGCDTEDTFDMLRISERHETGLRQRIGD